MIVLDVDDSMFDVVRVDANRRIALILVQMEVSSKDASNHIVDSSDADRAIVDSLGQVSSPPSSIGHRYVKTRVRRGDTSMLSSPVGSHKSLESELSF